MKLDCLAPKIIIHLPRSIFGNIQPFYLHHSVRVWICQGIYPGEEHSRVKSSKFGQSAKFGQRPCFFYFWIIGIKIKLSKQTVKILMRRLWIIWIFTVCKRMSEFTRCPKLLDFTLILYTIKISVTLHQMWRQTILVWNLNCFESYGNIRMFSFII